MSEHTPGPWVATGPSPGTDPCDDGGDYAISAVLPNAGDNRRKYIIAEAIQQVDSTVFAPAEANARLIASAPDMAAEIERLKAEHGVLLEASESAYVILHHLIDIGIELDNGWDAVLLSAADKQTHAIAKGGE